MVRVVQGLFRDQQALCVAWAERAGANRYGNMVRVVQGLFRDQQALCVAWAERAGAGLGRAQTALHWPPGPFNTSLDLLLLMHSALYLRAGPMLRPRSIATVPRCSLGL